MANNEILKSELLNEEQLDNVVGGTWGELYEDMLQAHLRKVPGFEDIYVAQLNDPNSELSKMGTDESLRQPYIDKLTKYFAEHGITFKYDGSYIGQNSYIYKGRNYSREWAWRIVDGK